MINQYAEAQALHELGELLRHYQTYRLPFRTKDPIAKTLASYRFRQDKLKEGKLRFYPRSLILLARYYRFHPTEKKDADGNVMSDEARRKDTRRCMLRWISTLTETAQSYLELPLAERDRARLCSPVFSVPLFDNTIPLDAILAEAEHAGALEDLKQYPDFKHLPIFSPNPDAEQQVMNAKQQAEAARRQAEKKKAYGEGDTPDFDSMPDGEKRCYFWRVQLWRLARAEADALEEKAKKQKKTMQTKTAAKTDEPQNDANTEQTVAPETETADSKSGKDSVKEKKNTVLKLAKSRRVRTMLLLAVWYAQNLRQIIRRLEIIREEPPKPDSEPMCLPFDYDYAVRSVMEFVTKSHFEDCAVDYKDFLYVIPASDLIGMRSVGFRFADPKSVPAPPSELELPPIESLDDGMRLDDDKAECCGLTPKGMATLLRGIFNADLSRLELKEDYQGKEESAVKTAEEKLRKHFCQFAETLSAPQSDDHPADQKILQQYHKFAAAIADDPSLQDVRELYQAFLTAPSPESYIIFREALNSLTGKHKKLQGQYKKLEKKLTQQQGNETPNTADAQTMRDLLSQIRELLYPDTDDPRFCDSQRKAACSILQPYLKTEKEKRTLRKARSTDDLQSARKNLLQLLLGIREKKRTDPIFKSLDRYTDWLTADDPEQAFAALMKCAKTVVITAQYKTACDILEPHLNTEDEQNKLETVRSIDDMQSSRKKILRLLLGVWKKQAAPALKNFINTLPDPLNADWLAADDPERAFAALLARARTVAVMALKGSPVKHAGIARYQYIPDDILDEERIFLLSLPCAQTLDSYKSIAKEFCEKH